MLLNSEFCLSAGRDVLNDPFLSPLQLRPFKANSCVEAVLLLAVAGHYKISYANVAAWMGDEVPSALALLYYVPSGSSPCRITEYGTYLSKAGSCQIFKPRVITEGCFSADVNPYHC